MSSAGAHELSRGARLGELELRAGDLLVRLGEELGRHRRLLFQSQDRRLHALQLVAILTRILVHVAHALDEIGDHLGLILDLHGKRLALARHLLELLGELGRDFGAGRLHLFFEAALLGPIQVLRERQRRDGIHRQHLGDHFGRERVLLVARQDEEREDVLAVGERQAHA
jgi:hypothetical protein